MKKLFFLFFIAIFSFSLLNSQSPSEKEYDEQTYLKKGEELIKMGYYQKSYKYFIKVNEMVKKDIAANGNDINILKKRGYLLYYLGDFDESVKCYQKVLELDPKNIQIEKYLTTLKKKYNNYLQKKYELNSNLSVDSNSYIGLFEQGKLIKDFSKIEALKLFDKALEIKPYFIEAIKQKANIFEELRNMGDALICYEKVIDIFPEDYEAWLKIGEIHIFSDTQKAINCFDKAIELEPDSYNAYLHKASALQLLGKSAEAEECNKKALELQIIKK